MPATPTRRCSPRRGFRRRPRARAVTPRSTASGPCLPRLRAAQPRVQRHAGEDRQADERHERRLLRALPHARGHEPGRADVHVEPRPAPDVSRRGDLRRLSPAGSGLRQDQRTAPARRGEPVRAGVRPERERRAAAGDRGRRSQPADRSGTARPRGARRGARLLSAAALGALRVVPRRQFPRRVPSRGSVQRVQALAGRRQRRDLPGLPHGRRAGGSFGLRDRSRGAGGGPADTAAQAQQSHVRGPGLLDRPSGHLSPQSRGSAVRDAARMAGLRPRGGMGDRRVEEAMPDGYEFPPRWAEPDDRYDAVDILRDNLDLLAEMAEQRRRLLRAGYQLGEVVVDRAGEDGIAFRVEFRNGTDGHNVPTGFDAERLVWLHVTVTDAAGTVVFESGDLDPNGDVRDSHSVYVHDGELPADDQLFSLQSRFLVRMVRGGEREQVLAVPYSPSPLVFLRPSTRSTILTGRPAGARKHRRTIPPRRSKWASYSVGPEALAGTTGPYYATIRVKAGMVPVNLVHEIADVGFDYGMTEREVAEAVVAGHVLVRERAVNLSAGGVEEDPPSALLAARVCAVAEGGCGADAGRDAVHAGSRLSDEHVPLQLDAVPEAVARGRSPVSRHRPDRPRLQVAGRGGVAPVLPAVRRAAQRRERGGRRDRARQRVGEPHRSVRQPRAHRQRAVRLRAASRRSDGSGRPAPVQRLHGGGDRCGRLQPAAEPRLGHGDPPVLRGRFRRAVSRPGSRRPARPGRRPVRAASPSSSRPACSSTTSSTRSA